MIENNRLYVGGVVFGFTPNEVDENNQLTELALIHQKMLDDFKDEAKLEQFKDLLRADHNTAFNIYNGL